MKFCVLGRDIGYTLSPKLHAVVFGELGVNATYGVEDVASLDGQTLKALDDYDGYNVTKPYKEEILQYLDDCRAGINAVNVVRKENGKRVGYNTDVVGFWETFAPLAGDIAGKQVVVLGAGGAAEAVIKALCGKNADVTVHNRTLGRAQRLAERYGARATDDARGLKPDVIINTTSVGGDGANAMPTGIDLTRLTVGYDVVYTRPRTAFLETCESVGARVKNGAEMLVRQALVSDEIFLERTLDKERLTQVILKRLQGELPI